MQVMSDSWALVTTVKMPFLVLRIEIEPFSVAMQTSELLGIRIPAVALPIFYDG
jgi:hypothetical protein